MPLSNSWKNCSGIQAHSTGFITLYWCRNTTKGSKKIIDTTRTDRKTAPRHQLFSEINLYNSRKASLVFPLQNYFKAVKLWWKATNATPQRKATMLMGQGASTALHCPVWCTISVIYCCKVFFDVSRVTIKQYETIHHLQQVVPQRHHLFSQGQWTNSTNVNDSLHWHKMNSTQGSFIYQQGYQTTTVWFHWRYQGILN